MTRNVNNLLRNAEVALYMQMNPALTGVEVADKYKLSRNIVWKIKRDFKKNGNREIMNYINYKMGADSEK